MSFSFFSLDQASQTRLGFSWNAFGPKENCQEKQSEQFQHLLAKPYKIYTTPSAKMDAQTKKWHAQKKMGPLWCPETLHVCRSIDLGFCKTSRLSIATSSAWERSTNVCSCIPTLLVTKKFKASIQRPPKAKAVMQLLKLTTLGSNLCSCISSFWDPSLVFLDGLSRGGRRWPCFERKQVLFITDICCCFWVFVHAFGYFPSTHLLISFSSEKSHSTVLVVLVYTFIDLSGLSVHLWIVISLVIRTPSTSEKFLRWIFSLWHPLSKWNLQNKTSSKPGALFITISFVIPFQEVPGHPNVVVQPRNPGMISSKEWLPSTHHAAWFTTTYFQSNGVGWWHIPPHPPNQLSSWPSPRRDSRPVANNDFCHRH